MLLIKEMLGLLVKKDLRSAKQLLNQLEKSGDMENIQLYSIQFLDVALKSDNDIFDFIVKEILNNRYDLGYFQPEYPRYKDKIDKIIEIMRPDQLEKFVIIQNDQGENLLHQILKYGDTKQIYILKENINIDTFDVITTMQDCKGNTPLHLACIQSMDFNIILELVREFSTLYVTNNMGNIPLDFVVNDKQCREILIDFIIEDLAQENRTLMGLIKNSISKYEVCTLNDIAHEWISSYISKGINYFYQNRDWDDERYSDPEVYWNQAFNIIYDKKCLLDIGFEVYTLSRIAQSVMQYDPAFSIQSYCKIAKSDSKCFEKIECDKDDIFMAIKYSKLQDHKNAAIILNKIVDSDTILPAIKVFCYGLLGQEYEIMQEKHKAIITYSSCIAYYKRNKSAICLQKEIKDIYFNRSLLYLEGNQYKEAILDILSIMRFDYEDVDTYNNYIEIKNELDKNEKVNLLGGLADKILTLCAELLISPNEESEYLKQFLPILKEKTYQLTNMYTSCQSEPPTKLEPNL